MCQKCQKIDAEIAYYEQRLIGFEDPTAIGLFKLLIEELNSDKASLHAKDK